MPRARAIPLSVVLSACASAPLSLRQPPEPALALLRSFAGEWLGTFLWQGARSDHGEMGAHYYVPGNGSAVVEDLIQRRLPTMTSVYHLDGADLRMTHFCGAGNQPRLRATAIDAEHRRVAFAFVDITNAPSPDAPHVDGFELQSADDDHLQLVFHFTANGRSSTEFIELTRQRP